MLSPVERKLAALMLDKASDEFGNHTCNDFDLVKEGGLTEEEAIDFTRRYHDYNGDPEEFDPKYARYLVDFAVMGFLAHLLQSED